ncbi:PTS system mannose/fructose/sorbose family transporter subunit IID [Liquorilactobacillus vini]|uniref:PTS system mannose/fructose/sorbose family transporter subunit IID n=1 Tax=Liquorilactobacillus vini TaxID=238015 RepID=UPI00029A061E|nr:PTS system mannose/fructose/sorbose family transporter subunit IID [Liquorilactobacillus vini]
MTSNEKKLTNKDINHIFWRSLSVNASFNYERQMSQGAQYSLGSVLKKLYPEKNRLAQALKRHAEFFNTTPMLCPFIFGISAAMEEENANKSDFDESSINSIKASLMGPLAGIGDSVFWGTLRPLVGGIACSLALTGNLFAPILFLLLFNVPNMLVRYYGVHWGYNSGMKALDKFEKLGITEKIFQGASTLGLLVIGSMIAEMVTVKTGLTIGSGKSAIKLMSVLNGIMPDMLSLGVTGLIYWAIKKGHKVNTLLLWILVISIFAALFGILKA